MDKKLEDLRYIVIHTDSDGEVAYHSGEPEALTGERDGYCGGFSYEIAEAISHENPILAHLECKRISEIYNDIADGDWTVRTMTAKELFKARLGA